MRIASETGERDRCGPEAGAVRPGECDLVNQFALPFGHGPAGDGIRIKLRRPGAARLMDRT